MGVILFSVGRRQRTGVSYFKNEKFEFFLRGANLLTVNYQYGVARKVRSTLHSVSEGQGKVLACRPFYVWWFMGQLAM